MHVPYTEIFLSNGSFFFLQHAIIFPKLQIFPWDSLYWSSDKANFFPSTEKYYAKDGQENGGLGGILKDL